MNKGDIEFTVDLNTTPAEKKLNDLRNKASSERSYYANLFKDVMQGFSMQGSSYSGYMGANNFGVPAIQNFERSISSVTNTMQKFTMVMEAMVRAQGFLMYGRPYSPQSSAPIYQGSNIAGYLPSSTSPNIRAWTPTEHYTRAQANAINHSKVFDNLIFNRKNGGSDFSQQNVYDTFMRMNNASAMYEMWLNTFSSSPLMLEAPEPISTGAGGNKIYQKYNKFGQPVTEKNKKTKEIVEEQKKVTEENKKDNTEWADKLVKINKFFATLLLVKQVVNIIKSAFNGIKELSIWGNQNVSTNYGYFTTDAENAFNARFNKTFSSMVAGANALGKMSPISADVLYSGVGGLQKVVDEAFSGKGVNKDKLIAIEQLHRMFGTELTSGMLLSKNLEGKTVTDFFVDIMNKFNNNPNIYKNASYSEQAQMREYLKEILGDKLANAIVTNITRGESQTVAEQLTNAGRSAFNTDNLVENANELKTAFTELGNAMSALKMSALNNFMPAIKGTIDLATIWSDFFTRHFTEHTSYDKDATYQLSWLGHTKDEYNKISVDKIAELRRSKNAYERLDSILYLNPYYNTDASIEILKERMERQNFALDIANGNINANSKNWYAIGADGKAYNSVDQLKKVYLARGGKKSDAWYKLMDNPSKFLPKNWYTLSKEEQLNWLNNNVLNTSSQVMNDWSKRIFEGYGDFDSSKMSATEYLTSSSSMESEEEALRAWQEVNRIISAVNDESYSGMEFSHRERHGTSYSEADELEVKLHFTTDDQGVTVVNPLQILKANTR